ncbi:hypothetical protein BC332_25330 [Capsicum chinense]|nr:hypothetical protein BC332_25330 [Capsicum chinense]
MDWWLTHVTELTNEKAKLKEDFTKYEEEMVELSVQVVKHQATCKTLSCENDLLNEILSEISKHDPKCKARGNSEHKDVDDGFTNIVGLKITSCYRSMKEAISP